MSKMMRSRKGQAAMEFLMTYGWAILVVLAAVGILAYLGLFDQAQRAPNKCELWPVGQGLECKEEPDANSGTGDIQFTAQNLNGYDVDGITFASSTTCTGVTANNITKSQTGLITLTGCTLTQGERYNEEFTITYVSGESGQTHSTTGKVSGNAR